MTKWKYIQQSGKLLSRIYSDDGGLVGIFNVSPSEKDGKLMALSPEMLELLKTANNSMSGSHTVWWQRKCREILDAVSLNEEEIKDKK